MDREIYRYHFGSVDSVSTIEELLLLAILAVECLHGASVVRLEAAYYLDEEKRSCVLEAGSDAGRDIARIFTGFLTRELGEDGFRVEKVRDEGEKAVVQGAKS